MINVTPAQLAKIRERPKYVALAVIASDDGEFSERITDFSVQGQNAITINSGGVIPFGNILTKHIVLSFESDHDARVYANAELLLAVGIEGEAELYDEYHKVTAVRKTDNQITIEADDMLAAAPDPLYEPFGDWNSLRIYPLIEIAKRCCTQLQFGIGLDELTFPNSSISVREIGCKGKTCKQVLAMIAQIAGANVLLGSYNGWPAIRFRSLIGAPVNTLDKWLNIEVGDPVTCTGLNFKQTFDGFGNPLEEPIEFNVGEPGYVFSFENSLIDRGYENQILTKMGEQLIGQTFVNFRGSHINYPIAEINDAVSVTHRGGSFNSFLTGITHNIFGMTDFECAVPTGQETSTGGGGGATGGVTSTTPAVLYVAQQLSDEQKAQARANIGAGGGGGDITGAVRYDTVQSLTEAQKEQARNNIGAGTGSGGETFDINALTQTSSLANADTFPFYDDSAAGPRKTTWSNIKSKLKTYFDTLYLGISALAGYATEAWVQSQSYVRYDTMQELNDTEKTRARVNIGAGKYSKPTNGIPKTDFTSAVQTSLGKADTAVQRFEVTFSQVDGTWSADKTHDEIYNAAFTDGKLVVGKLPTTRMDLELDYHGLLGAEHMFHASVGSTLYEISYSYSGVVYFNTYSLSTLSWVQSQGYATEAWVTAKGYGTYSLPAGGIPENQLASAVQTKLNSSTGLDFITYDNADHPSGGRTRRCRRWNSGLQEHWYSIPMNNVAINTAFGSMFRSEFEGNHAYMKAFVSGDGGGNPISDISWQPASGSNPAFTWMVDPTDVTGSTSSGPGTPLSMTPKFGLVRPDNTTVSGIATIYTRGYWK